MQFGTGLVIALAALMVPATSLAAICDVDDDGDIDRLDLREISRARNTPASGPDDPRDADGDGVITPRDVKACIPQCTLPGCEEPAAGIPLDACEDPGAVDCNGSVTVDNTAFTTDPDDPEFSCHFLAPDQGVGSAWFTFVATETTACLDTNDSAVSDTLLAVYDGTCGSLVELACSEDEGDGLLSELCVEGLTVGDTYYVQVASFSDSSQGSITLNTTCLPPDAIDACEAPGTIDCNGSVTVDNTAFTTDPDDPEFSCHFLAPDQGVGSVWFTFVATETSACLDTNDSAVSDTLLAVYDGTCGSLTELACSEDEGDGLLSELCVEGLTVGDT
ncbi:MAG: hypothetical protein PVF51_09680, partial [Nitrospirota bacterium]